MLISYLITLIILGGSIKLYTISNSPFVASAGYTFVILLLGLSMGFTSFLFLLLSSVINFAVVFAYFRLLYKFRDSGFYWGILMCGLLVPLWDTLFGFLLQTFGVLT